MPEHTNKPPEPYAPPPGPDKVPQPEEDDLKVVLVCPVTGVGIDH